MVTSTSDVASLSASSSSSPSAAVAAAKKPPTLHDIASRLKLDTTSVSDTAANKENVSHSETIQPLENKGRLGLPGRLNSFNSSDGSSGHQPPTLLAHGAPPSATRSSFGASPILGSAPLHPDSAAAAAAAVPISGPPHDEDKSPSQKTKALPTLEDIRERMSKQPQPADADVFSAAGASKAPSERDLPARPAANRVKSASPSAAQVVGGTDAKISANTLPVKPAVSEAGATALHPLQHEWTLFFDSKTFDPAGTTSAAETSYSIATGQANIDAYAPWLAKNGESSSSGAGSPMNVQQPLKGSASSESWEAALKRVGQYHTVESFLQVFAKIRRPSSLDKQASYHLFKDGIKPMWEDPANASGGKWIISFQRSVSNPALLDRSWMWLVLALIGEELDADDDATGAVVSLRPKADRISLWLRGKEDVNKINSIGRRLADLLEIQDKPGVSLEFNTHAGGAKRARAPPSPTGTWETFWSFDNFVSAQQQNMSSTSSGPLANATRQVSGSQQAVPGRASLPARQSALGGPIGRSNAGGNSKGGLLGRAP